MNTTIRIPTVLRKFAGGSVSVDVNGDSVLDAIRDLTTRYPALENHLFAADGSLRSFVNIYVNDEDVRERNGASTRLEGGETVSIVPAVAGGLDQTVARTGEISTNGQSGETTLSQDELRRYQRHLTLPEVGVEGQKKLKESSVLLIGAGGLGSPLALYLAAAGVGRIGIVDFDSVDESNLQRQILHGTGDVGRPKLESARDRLKDINPNVKLDLHEVRLSSENALELVADYDVVADGTDNFPTRYLVNDACVLTGTPNAYASIFQFEGQASVFGAEDGPCYRCLYPEPPPPGLVPSCAEGGVLGILPGLMGTLQATEVIKLLLGIGEPLVGRLLLFDALEMSFRTLKVRRNPDCPVCGEHPTVTELIDYEEFCGIPTRDGVRDTHDEVPEVTVQYLKALRDAGETPFVLDVRKPFEADIATLGADQLIPHDELEFRIAELNVDRDHEIIVHCRSGVRSAKAVHVLHAAGFERAVNLAGGILEWSREIDSSVAEY